MLFKEQITAVLLAGHLGTRAVLGFADGNIRIYETGSWELKETIAAFCSGKKGSVTRLRCHSTGGLYASSSSGLIKLLRLSI